MAWKETVLSWLKITSLPVVRVYDGYSNHKELLLYGHVLKLSPLPRRRYRQNVFLNFLAMIRLFIVKPVAGGRVILELNNETHETTTDADGEFQFNLPLLHPLPGGWHTCRVLYVAPLPAATLLASGEGRVFVPHNYQTGFISDIDDTFLISHSTNLRKRLWVLFTRNAVTRQPFEGVADYYKALSEANRVDSLPNPFFFVSSSEWNLFYYIKKFCQQYELPEGILLLSRLKQISQILKTAQSKHATKYLRIAHILRTFPQRKYILLGDNSQMDPEIYRKVVEDFPELIRAVYIRNVVPANLEKTLQHLRHIEQRGVPYCFFAHTSEAFQHSRTAGILG